MTEGLAEAARPSVRKKGESVLEFRDVSFAYVTQDGEREALCGVSFSLVAGETLAVLGSNGSGKSTLAKLCDALLVPSVGVVLVDGMDTCDESHTWDIRARVGLVFQNPDNQIVGTSVEEDAAFGPENLGLPRDEIRARVDRSLAAVGLAGLERREPHTLSEGQKQRLAISGVLALQPAYLVADEPTALLDPASRTEVLDVLHRVAREGAAVMHITQDTSEALAADRVLVMKDGRVGYLGTPLELFADEALLASLEIAVPPLVRLAAELRASGAPAPILPVRAEEVVEALWPS